MSDMENQPLGPSHLRVGSILDSTHKGDMFTAYCDRHTQEMEDEQTMVKWDGCIYRVKKPFSFYYCKKCLYELAHREKVQPEVLAQTIMIKLFKKWDEGETPYSDESEVEWFEYIGEAEDVDGITLVKPTIE